MTRFLQKKHFRDSIDFFEDDLPLPKELTEDISKQAAIYRSEYKFPGPKFNADRQIVTDYVKDEVVR